MVIEARRPLKLTITSSIDDRLPLTAMTVAATVVTAVAAVDVVAVAAAAIAAVAEADAAATASEAKSGTKYQNDTIGQTSATTQHLKGRFTTLLIHIDSHIPAGLGVSECAMTAFSHSLFFHH